jgi:hypothetical protein
VTALMAVGVGRYNRHVRPDGRQQLVDLARDVARRLAARQPVVVDVEGYGAGWYITAVDWGQGLFTVRRGGGDPIDVAWGSVR